MSIDVFPFDIAKSLVYSVFMMILVNLGFLVRVRGRSILDILLAQKHKVYIFLVVLIISSIMVTCSSKAFGILFRYFYIIIFFSLLYIFYISRYVSFIQGQQYSEAVATGLLQTKILVHKIIGWIIFLFSPHSPFARGGEHYCRIEKLLDFNKNSSDSLRHPVGISSHPIRSHANNPEILRYIHNHNLDKALGD